MTKAENQLGNRPIPFHFCHGDFTPWNCKQVGPTLLLYDWEYASRERPAGWDIIRFFVQTQRFLERRSPGEIRLSFGTDGCAGRVLREHLAYLGAEQDLANGLVTLYLLDELAFHAAENPTETGALRLVASLLNLIILGTDG